MKEEETDKKKKKSSRKHWVSFDQKTTNTNELYKCKGGGGINQPFHVLFILQSRKVLLSVRLQPLPMSVDNKHCIHPLSDCDLNWYFSSDILTTKPSTYKVRIFWSAGEENGCSKPETFNLWPIWKMHPACNLLQPALSTSLGLCSRPRELFWLVPASIWLQNLIRAAQLPPITLGFLPVQHTAPLLTRLLPEKDSNHSTCSHQLCLPGKQGARCMGFCCQPKPTPTTYSPWKL